MEGRRSRGGNHVERPRSDRTGDGDDLSPIVLLRVRYRGVGHTLFVPPLVERQTVVRLLDRLTESDHYTMTEDSEDTLNELDLPIVHLQVLVVQKPHQRLSNGQSNRLHTSPPPFYSAPRVS